MRHLFVASLILSLAGSVSSFSATEKVILSEFMAYNTHVLNDEDGDASDWIEVRNAGSDRINLAGWFLTDAANNLTKWRFPATNLNAGAQLIVFASNKDRRTPGQPLHTNFRLEQNGEY